MNIYGVDKDARNKSSNSFYQARSSANHFMKSAAANQQNESFNHHIGLGSMITGTAQSVLPLSMQMKRFSQMDSAQSGCPPLVNTNNSEIDAVTIKTMFVVGGCGRVGNLTEDTRRQNESSSGRMKSLEIKNNGKEQYERNWGCCSRAD